MELPSFSLLFFCDKPHSICYVDGFVKLFIRNEDGEEGGKTPKPQTRALLHLDRWWGLYLHEFVIVLIEITLVYCSQAMPGMLSGMGLPGWGGRKVPLQKCRAVEILQKARRDSSTSWALAADPGSGTGWHLPAASLCLPFPSGNYCRERMAPDSVAGAWETRAALG